MAIESGNASARYRGPLKAVILDWAGTTVDFGSSAPVAVLLEIFERRGVPITTEEARANMGLLKKDHIRALCRDPAVRERWREAHGAPPGEREVDELFADFVPRQMDILERHSQLIPGVADAVSRMRARALKTGGTTGYTRAMLDRVMAYAAPQGYAPDVSLCPDDTGAGRPQPWMCFEILRRLQVYPPAACVKIGDTPADVAEGLNAGMWTVGVAATGNEVGLTKAAFDALDRQERQSRVEIARSKLWQAGAHYVIDSVAECDAILDDIERCLRAAERP